MLEKIDNYLDKLDRSTNTLKTYSWALHYFAAKVGEDSPLDMETYERFLNEIRELSPSSKRVLVTAVSGLYEFYNAGDPLQIARLNKTYTRKIKTQPVVFDRDAVEKIIAYCDGLRDGLIELRDRSFVLTLADSGLRISELAGLKRGEIDWNEQRAIITGKGGKIAAVRLSVRSTGALRDYLNARAKMDGASGRPLRSLPLFAQHGKVKRIKAITPDGMRKSIKARMEEAGARCRIHDFRHYFVTVVLLVTGNLKTAQELARHESATTTQRYAHLTNTELDKDYDEIFNK